jgi:TonB family protein
MNRVQKKCFIGSIILHGALGATLLFGPGFLSRQPPPSVLLEVIPDPSRITDDPTHGGDRSVQPPPISNPQPPQPPQQQVTPPAPPNPEPPKEIVKPEPARNIKPDPNALESKTSQTKKPQISTNLVVRSANTKPNVKTPSGPSAKEIADAQRRIIRQTISGISTGLSPATTTTAEPGPGDGGPLSASYRDLVGSIYEAAWVPPDNPASDSAIVRASVTISSDGRVVSTRIKEPSGDAEVDASVKRTLNQVTYIGPFPKGTTDKERTYTIKFDLKAKRLT